VLSFHTTKLEFVVMIKNTKYPCKFFNITYRQNQVPICELALIPIPTKLPSESNLDVSVFLLQGEYYTLLFKGLISKKSSEIHMGAVGSLFTNKISAVGSLLSVGGLPVLSRIFSTGSPSVFIDLRTSVNTSVEKFKKRIPTIVPKDFNPPKYIINVLKALYESEIDNNDIISNSDILNDSKAIAILDQLLESIEGGELDAVPVAGSALILKMNGLKTMLTNMWISGNPLAILQKQLAEMYFQIQPNLDDTYTVKQNCPLLQKEDHVIKGSNIISMTDVSRFAQKTAVGVRMYANQDANNRITSTTTNTKQFYSYPTKDAEEGMYTYFRAPWWASWYSINARIGVAAAKTMDSKIKTKINLDDSNSKSPIVAKPKAPLPSRDKVLEDIVKAEYGKQKWMLNALSISLAVVQLDLRVGDVVKIDLTDSSDVITKKLENKVYFGQISNILYTATTDSKNTSFTCNVIVKYLRTEEENTKLGFPKKPLYK